MAEIIGGILLKFGLCFVSDLIRSYWAERLQDGGLTDQRLRGWIVREFDDITRRLESLSRVHLSASTSFLNQGVQRLLMCLDTNREQLAGFTTTEPTQVVTATVEDAAKLAPFIQKMKVDSKELFESSKRLFRKAGEKATEAFHNAALSPEERILANNVRIASSILENLDHLEIAANVCLIFLQELHEVPAIKKIFSVHIKRGIGYNIQKKQRAKIVETVTMINLILADFITKFTTRRMGVLEWPMIECDKLVIHLIHHKRETAATVHETREMETAPPWEIVRYEGNESEEIPVNFAMNSKGDLFGVSSDCKTVRKLDRRTGKWQTFCVVPTNRMYTRCNIAIDDEDTVYIISASSIRAAGNPGDWQHDLSVFYSNGEVKSCSHSYVAKPELVNFTVAKNRKNIAIWFSDDRGYIIFIRSLEKEALQRFERSHKNSEFVKVLGLFASGDKEITVAHCKNAHSTNEIQLEIYKQEDEETTFDRRRKIRLSSPASCFGITFDHVTNKYIICCRSDDVMRLEFISETDEHRNIIYLDGKDVTEDTTHWRLINHLNGAIAMVNTKCALYLRCL